MMTARELVELAFSPEKRPEWVHPSKKQWLQTGDPELDALLPELSKGEQSYLEFITSQNYDELVKRIEHYTGLDANDVELPSLLSLGFQAIMKIQDIESQHKKQLEDLALDTVLELPEFKMVKDAWYGDEVEFDVQLAKPELQRARFEDDPPDDGGLSSAEEANMELASELSGVSDQQLRRKLANLMIQGQATYKAYLFNLVTDALEKIDPELPEMYGLVTSTGQLGFWGVPFGIEKLMAGEDEAQLGSEEVVPKGDKYVIKARAKMFPILILEIVKGIYEWISLDPELQGEMDKDSIEGETKDIIVGPELAKIMMSYIPTADQELTPLIHKKFLQLPREEVKAVFAKNPRGKQVMARLISQAQEEWKSHQQEKETA